MVLPVPTTLSLSQVIIQAVECWPEKQVTALIQYKCHNIQVGKMSFKGKVTSKGLEHGRTESRQALKPSEF